MNGWHLSLCRRTLEQSTSNGFSFPAVYVLFNVNIFRSNETFILLSVTWWCFIRLSELLSVLSLKNLPVSKLVIKGDVHSSDDRESDLYPIVPFSK